MLKKTDLKIYGLIEAEKKRQNEEIELIASENYASEAVLEAMGSILTNKYSEGYPSKRYYGGQEYIDAIENLARERAIKLFVPAKFRKDWHANVQPYSGSPANLAVYFALLDFGDTVMGMGLSHGGHLTHGHKVNFSGRSYNFIQYGVDESGVIDYEEVYQLAEEYQPKLIVSGATAYPRVIDFEKFSGIAREVGAIHMVDMSHIAGLVAGDVHPSPIPYADVVTSTTHKTLRGPRSAFILCRKEFAEKIDKAVFPGLQGGPHDHITAAKAICFYEAAQPAFKKYARRIVKNAKALAAELTNYNFDIVSGGTDNHLLLIDLTNKNITGAQTQTALDAAGITLNKNMVPNDPRSPFDPSGVRLGTAAVTTRGMKEKEMRKIAAWINEGIENFSKPAKLKKIKNEVAKFARRFPVPGIK